MAIKTSRYPSAVSDEEWVFCAPYLTLLKEQAPPRQPALRDIFKALHWLVRAGCPWRMMPHDLPPRPAVPRYPKLSTFPIQAHWNRLKLRPGNPRGKIRRAPGDNKGDLRRL